MPGSWFYDLVYRFGVPWELGVASELRTLRAELGKYDGPGRNSMTRPLGDLRKKHPAAKGK